MKNSSLKLWLSAARPQTLAAALVPVLVGASLALNDHLFRWDTTLTALFCAFAIQIGTNFANDYFDHVNGADTDDRIGFERATATGLISPKAMLTATFLTMGIAFAAGMYLVYVAGWAILGIGILAILFGILYTGGPFPLGYNGLGDLFVFLFFGLAAVMGTYYVNAFEWSAESFWASLPIGALCVNILVVNNLRDIEQDRAAGKRTLGVLFGETILKYEYLLMILIAFLTPFYFYYMLSFSIWIFIPFISLPIARSLYRRVWYHERKEELNRTLEHTAQYMTLYGILFSTGIIL